MTTFKLLVACVLFGLVIAAPIAVPSAVGQSPGEIAGSHVMLRDSSNVSKAGWFFGTGSPESAQDGPKGSLYANVSDGHLWWKSSAVGTTTGWYDLGAWVAAAPEYRLVETDASANEGKWRLRANAGQFVFDTLNDAENSQSSIFMADRTGVTADFWTSMVHFLAGGANPSITSGFGTSPSIAGEDEAFRVTVGSAPGTSGVVAFGTAFGTAPVCVANDETTSIVTRAVPTTTQVTVNGAFVAGDVVSVVCRGY